MKPSKTDDESSKAMGFADGDRLAVPENMFSSKGDALRFLENLSDRSITVQVTDGRQYVGRLWCTDDSANIVMSNAVEHPTESEAIHPNSDSQVRHLFVIVIPGKHIVKIECNEDLTKASNKTFGQ